jgi:DNA-binding protein H-NS
MACEVIVDPENNQTANGEIMDLSTLSQNELRRLLTRIEAELRRRNDTARRNLLKRMEKMAAEEGLSLSDLLGASAPAAEPKEAAAKPGRRAANKKEKDKEKVAPVIKYRHPEDAAKGWSGRGRKPQWAIDWINQGKSLEELAV